MASRELGREQGDRYGVREQTDLKMSIVELTLCQPSQGHGQAGQDKVVQRASGCEAAVLRTAVYFFDVDSFSYLCHPSAPSASASPGR